MPGLVDAVFAGYLATAGTLVPYVLNARALSRLEASRVAVISLVEPLTATILAVVLLGEKLTPVQAVGASLILVASLVSATGRGRGG
jgi:drug/metabolite transporter (DMT)-like permease